jgi:hypothetical protein
MGCVSLFFKTELGVEHISKSDTKDESPEASHPSGFTDWEERDREFQVSDAVFFFFFL